MQSVNFIKDLYLEEIKSSEISIIREQLNKNGIERGMSDKYAHEKMFNIIRQ